MQVDNPLHQPSSPEVGTPHEDEIYSKSSVNLSFEQPILNNSNTQPETLDHVIEHLEPGKFQMRLRLLCGLAFMADAMEVNLLAFMSVCAGAEWGLGDSQVASITSAVFAGEFIGGIFFGPVADIYGRRTSFLWTATLISIAGFLSGPSPNYQFLIAMRMIVGFGVGGLTVPYDLLAEFSPSKIRGEYLLKMSYFWTFGSMFIAGCAWAVLPVSTWRLLTVLSAAPIAITAVLSYFYLPESPRWLLEQGRIKEAEDVIQGILEFNGTTDRIIKLQPLQSSQKATQVPEFHTSTSTSSNTEKSFSREEPALKDLCIAQFNSYRNLVKPENIGYSVPLWAVWFSFGFCYYGVILFISRIYDIGSHKGCAFDFPPIFINASSEFVGLFTSIQVIDLWGRPKVMMTTFGLAAISVLFLGIPNTKTGTLVIGCFARASSMAANCTSWVLTPELYKTRVRATGHASCNAFERVGAILVPFVVQSQLSNVTVGIVLAAVNCIGILVSFLLPDMCCRDIDNPDYDTRTGEPINPLDYFLLGGYPRAFLSQFLPSACIK